MRLEYGYGNTIQTVEINESNLIAELHSNPVKHERTGQEAVIHALANPEGTCRLREMAGPGQRIVIVTSDISRPMPGFDVLPAVLDELYAAGAQPENICVVLALGSHRGHSEEEKLKLVGERCYNEVRVCDSDPDNTVHLGCTSRGTPVDFDRRVAEADLRICLGNVEFHYFAGYSGGYKALMPGVSTPSAIQNNHRLMASPAASAGRIAGNPVREDIEEAGAMLGAHFIVNVVLDEHKQIVYAAAGDAVAAHRKACAYLDRMYRKPIPRRADIVLVSQGGAPKDANLYQTQKALDNAKYAVRDGGTIILIGACTEGTGSRVFEEWLIDAASPSELTSRIGREFRLGGHKAAAIGKVLEKAEVFLVSEMDDALVRSMLMEPKASVQQAFDDALKKHGSGAGVISMPFGGATLPIPPDNE